MMENKNQPNRPAFPVVSNCDIIEDYQGLTKREYFAGVAMQGLLSSPYLQRHLNNIDLPDLTTIAEASVDYADAILEKLKNK